jgi:predicted nucleic-acid-binding protein
MTSEKILLIDTNVIIRYLLDDPPEHSLKAKRFMIKVGKGDLNAEIPSFVLAECVYVMRGYYGIPRAEIADKLKRMYNLTGIVNSDKGNILNALIKYEESNIDIQDCLIAAYSAPQKVVISFDNDMKKLNAFYENP